MKRILKTLAVGIAVFLIFVAVPHTVRAESSDTRGSGASQLYTVTAQDGVYSIDGRTSTDINALISDVTSGEGILLFDGVRVKEPLLLSGELSLCGSLTLERGAVFDGGNLYVSDADVTIISGSLRVKSGNVIMSSGRINAKDSAVLLDYSASSSFTMTGGELHSVSEAGTLRLTLGRSHISGGAVTNEASIAIYNSGELILSGEASVKGVAFDIETRNAVRLSAEGKYYTAALKVKYPATFSEGSFSKVFLSASEEQVKKIRLFDNDMREQSLSYFESCRYTDERSIIAVSLPFEAVFRLGATEISRVEFLKGEIPNSPEVIADTGYKFDGWYSDPACMSAYTLSSPPNRNIDLYAGVKLVAPSFEISSQDFEYSANIHKLAFSSISHPLMDKGSFSYDWYKDGAALNLSSPEINLLECSDSGSYYCKLTFAYNGDFVTVTTPNITVNIRKKLIEIPIASAVEYTSDTVYPALPSSELYTVKCSGGISVGEYPVTLILEDPENTAWRGAEGDSVEISFKIVRATNAFLYLYAEDIYEGSNPKISAALKFGTYTAYYSSDGKSFSPDIPTSPGKYYVKCIARESENYTAAETEIAVFEILKRECVGIRIERSPDKTEYLPFDMPDLTGISLIATYNDGTTSPVDISEIAITYKNGSYLSGADSSVMLTYKGCFVPLPVTVGKLEYDMSNVLLSDKTVIYDGEFHTLSAELSIVGRDGSELKYKITGGGVNVGIYDVNVSFYTDSASYTVPEDVRLSLKIEPMPITLEYGAAEFIYDGKEHIPTAKYINAHGAYVTLKLNGAQTNAGIYVASVPSDLGNYSIVNPEVSYRILKADIDTSQFIWSERELVYSALVQRVELICVPAGVEVIGYIDGAAEDAGEYVAIAKIAYDERNYNPPAEISVSWRIVKANYDTSGFSFSDSEAVYDGEAHYPDLIGELPTGVDGIALRYTYSTYAKNVSDGTVLVKIDFSSESENYNIPDPLYATVKILPLEIEVEWQGQAFIYDGGSHIPTAHSDKCDISVSGVGKDAGEYVARAVSLDANFTVLNSDYPFTVHKAENEWLIVPSVTDIYESGSLTPIASSKYGEVRFSYFSDSSLTHSVDLPTASGVYYLRASVSEGKNYLPLISEAIRFEIIEVAPFELAVNVTKEQIAMNRLTDGVKITLINNDGSVLELSVADVEIIYQTADTFRYSDTYVTVAYGDLRASASVKVVKAEYDMSAVIWENTHHVYDGCAKYPTLSGLPDGVEVTSYVGVGEINAGNYTLGAVLSYDSENYHLPNIPVATLVIEKRKISVPLSAPVIYDGTYHSPVVEPSELYTAVIPNEKNAGKYPVSVILNDTDNYDLDEEIYFEILPRDITVKIMNDGKSYSIVSGSLILSDTLGEEYYTEGGLVYLRSKNPNYNITVIPSSSVASSNRIWLGIIVFLSVVLITLAVIIAVKYPDRLRAAAEALKRKMRSPVAAASAAQTYTTILATDKVYADSMISDVTAKTLLSKTGERIFTCGKTFTTVTLGAISEKFPEGSVVDVNSMKSAGLISEDVRSVRILPDGVIDKPLTVKASAFELSAVKMIALTGGKAIKVRECRKKLPPS